MALIFFFIKSLQSEVKKLQEQIETEVRLREDTDEKLAKMNQLLATGEEALQLENSEVKKLQEQIETEVRLRQDTDDKLAKMNQLLATGQEALQLEKKTVELLRQQVVSQTPTKVSPII